MRAILLFLLVITLMHPAQATQPPNVLLIVADDLGFSDLGCYGSDIQTPNLDRLAAQGLRYTQFYNTGRCWPTRAALLTGYYPQQVGRDALPNVPGGARGKRPAWARLLPEMLRALGYRCYHSGKWHIDGQPLENGFDHSLVVDGQNRFFYPLRTIQDGVRQPVDAKPPGYYLTTAIADHAIECLQEHAARYSDRPFFHYLAFTAPHFPLHALAEDIARYKGKFDHGWDEERQRRWRRIQEMGLVTGHLSPLEPNIGPPYRHFSDPAVAQLGPVEVDREVPWNDLTPQQKAFQAAKMEIHAAMIDRMDREIGRVLEQIEAMGAADNTLVMFLSDNGASAEIMIRGGGHDANAPLGSAATFLCLGPGWSRAANTPFRRHKTWVHEGGIATPLIVHWPGHIADPGGLRSQVGHVIDIPHTILEAAGGMFPTEYDGAPVPPSPGMSLLPSLDPSWTPRPRTLWWLHEGNRAVRRGDLKLVAAKGEPWQLYDMRNDRTESYDLSKQLPGEVTELETLWTQITSGFEAAASRSIKN